MGGRGSEIGEPKDMAHLASQDLTVDCSLCNFPQCVPVCATRLIKKELHKKFQLQTKTFDLYECVPPKDHILSHMCKCQVNAVRFKNIDISKILSDLT